MRRRLFLALCCWAGFWACPAVAAAELQPVRLADDFSTNTLKDYQVEGDVQWAKGRVTLGKGAKLTRKLALGHTAEFHAVVRLGAGPRTHLLFFHIWGQGAQSAFALLAPQGKAELWNLIKPVDRVPLDSAPLGAAWEVRFEVRYGVARAKAWPQGAREPNDWQTARYSGILLWEPLAVVIFPGQAAGGALTGLTISGLPPATPLSAAQKNWPRKPTG